MKTKLKRRGKQHRTRAKAASAVIRQPVHQKLWESLKKVEIDRIEAEKVVASLAEEHQKGAQADVDTILNRDFRFTVGQYGRVITNVSNIKRELRPTLRLNSQPLVEVDISCSQPTLLAAYLPQELRVYDDVRLFASLCTTGTLYDRLMQDLKFEDRNECKDAFFHFLYSPPIKLDARQKTWKNPKKERERLAKRAISEWFAPRFPTIWKFIGGHKTNGYYDAYKSLSQDMQRFESKIVIETACHNLYDQCPQIDVLTVHDSILVERAHAELTRSTLKAAFHNNTAIRPTISVKS